MKIVSKIAAAQVIGKVPTEIVDITSTDGAGVTSTTKEKRGIAQLLMRITGIATGFKIVPTPFGDSIGFLGQFECTNALTGEIYRSSKLYLPDIAADLMLPYVEAAEGNPVEFAFDIGAKPAGNAYGYEYTVTPLIEVTDSDPLRALTNRLLASAPALPAPKNAPQLALAGVPEASTVEEGTTKVVDGVKVVGTKKK